MGRYVYSRRDVRVRGQVNRDWEGVPAFAVLLLLEMGLRGGRRAGRNGTGHRPALFDAAVYGTPPLLGKERRGLWCEYR